MFSNPRLKFYKKRSNIDLLYMLSYNSFPLKAVFNTYKYTHHILAQVHVLIRNTSQHSHGLLLFVEQQLCHTWSSSNPQREMQIQIRTCVKKYQENSWNFIFISFSYMCNNKDVRN